MMLISTALAGLPSSEGRFRLAQPLVRTITTNSITRKSFIRQAPCLTIHLKNINLNAKAQRREEFFGKPARKKTESVYQKRFDRLFAAVSGLASLRLRVKARFFVGKEFSGRYLLPAEL